MTETKKPLTYAETQLTAEQLAGLAALRVPFSENQISLLPKPVKRAQEGEPRFECVPGPQLSKASKDGKACGGYHTWSIHLDYVGHAALTDRLLEVDPSWDWRPLAVDDNGLPLIDRNGGLWIELTVCGVTRLGYGDAPGKRAAEKELIGDALRNAGMRFGMALDLWHKGDLHDAAEEKGDKAGLAPIVTPAEIKAALPPEPPKRDWFKEAEQLATSDAVRALYLDAKHDGYSPANLKKIAQLGADLATAEEAEADLRAEAQAGAAALMSTGFGSENA